MEQSQPDIQDRTEKTAHTDFAGPLFLVGMPRSGTKLFREVLNNHSLIAITGNESHFIPYFHKKIKEYGNLQERANFHKFYDDFTKTVFFQRVTENDPFIDEDKWYLTVKDWSYAGVVEGFYRAYANHKGKRIWGDKTPFYLVILPLLKSLFPDAKFIHIIRDVRDYSLSLNTSWTKNLFRASQRWYDAVSKCRTDGKNLPESDYFEIRYEALVDSPEESIKSVCTFLDIPFESKMDTLKKPADHGGDAKGMLTIKPKNYGKWKERLTAKQIARIEKICGPLLKELGYPATYDGPAQPITKFRMKMYRLIDAWSLLRHEWRERSFKQGTVNFIKQIKYGEFRTPGNDQDDNA